MKQLITILAIAVMLIATPKVHAQTLIPSIPVLMYHRIQNCPTNTTDCADITVQPVEFKAQMDYLKANGYATLSIDELMFCNKYGLPLPPKSVLVVFDDGYATTYTQAYPILKANGQKATMFMVSGLINASGMLTDTQLKEMQRTGVFNIESHTVTHVRLSPLTQAQRIIELRDSQAALQNLLNVPVRYIAYPNGDINDTSVLDVKQYYDLGFIVCKVNCHKGDNSRLMPLNGDLFRMERVTVFPKTDEATFKMMLE